MAVDAKREALTFKVLGRAQDTSGGVLHTQSTQKSKYDDED